MIDRMVRVSLGFRIWNSTVNINYLLTYDSYVPLYNRFHRGEWITRVPKWHSLHSCHLRAQECSGPPPPHSPL
jgi:hypothetical protein